MGWRIYVILSILALFFILLILNPNLSCFGRKIRSPFYPLFRRKKKEIKTEDYGFSLAEGNEKRKSELKRLKTESAEKEQRMKKKALKTEDYGFSLAEDQDQQKLKQKEGEREKKEG
jgi:hypothetical protein